MSERYDSIKVRNTSGGPLAIMRTWDAPVESVRFQSTWKRAEGGMKRSVRKVTHASPSAFYVAPNEEVILPRAAANSDQIVGLHAAGRIRVTPVIAEAVKTPALPATPLPAAPAEPPPVPPPAPTPASSSEGEGGAKAEPTPTVRTRRGHGR